MAVDRLADVLIGPQLHTAVTVLFAATAFVLLIGCANLANLALARSIAREGEMAVRAALGASRLRLVQQFLIENVVIGLCGGIVGSRRWLRDAAMDRMVDPSVRAASRGGRPHGHVRPAVHVGRCRRDRPGVWRCASGAGDEPDLVSALKEGGQRHDRRQPGTSRAAAFSSWRKSRSHSCCWSRRDC